MNMQAYRIGDPAPHPLQVRSEEQITADWRSTAPLVSVLCATYQHAEFIEAAICGFLGQRTDFPFEILIRDDASTDGTAEIVRDFEGRYPGIIRAVLEPENRYRAVEPYRALLPLARGEFIAFCEGDDFWIAEDHLARAVRTLTDGPGIGASATVSRSVVINEGKVVGFEAARPDRWNWYLPTRALVMRRSVPLPDIEHTHGDNVLALEIQRHGRIEHGDAFVAVYRLHGGGVVSGSTVHELRPAQVAGYASIALHLAREGEVELARLYHEHAMQKLRWMLAPYGLAPPNPRWSFTTIARGLLERIRAMTSATSGDA